MFDLLACMDTLVWGYSMYMYMYFVVRMATCNLQVRKKAQFSEL